MCNITPSYRPFRSSESGPASVSESAAGAAGAAGEPQPQTETVGVSVSVPSANNVALRSHDEAGEYSGPRGRGKEGGGGALDHFSHVHMTHAIARPTQRGPSFSPHLPFSRRFHRQFTTPLGSPLEEILRHATSLLLPLFYWVLTQ